MRRVFGKRRKEPLTDFEQSLYKCLTERIGLNPYHILFHVPLSQVLDPSDYQGRKKSIIFQSTAPLVLLETEQYANISGIGLYPNHDKEVSILLRQAGITLFELVPTLGGNCNALVGITNELRTHKANKTLINKFEFQAKRETEKSLREILTRQFFSQRNSLLRWKRTVDAPKIDFLDLGFLISSDNTPLEALYRVEQFIDKRRDHFIKENFDPYADYYFLHEFSVSRLIEPLPLANRYEDISDHWNDVIQGIVKQRLIDPTTKPSGRVTDVSHEKFTNRQQETLAKRIHEEIHRDSDRLNQYLERSCIDLLVLNPDAVPVVAVEFDGPRHDEPEKKEKDELKDLGLALLGIPCIRIHYSHRLKDGKHTANEKAIENCHKQYFAFIFTFFIERLHRNREFRLHSEHVRKNMDRYVGEAIKREQDPEIRKLMEEFSRKLEEKGLMEADKSRNVDSRTFEELDDREKEIFVEEHENMYFETETSVQDENGLISEIFDTTRSKEMHLRKAYGDKCIDIKPIADTESRTLKAVLIIRNETGAPIETRELSLPPLLGSWRSQIGDPNKLDYAFLRSHLIDQAYQTMIRRFREKT